MAASLSEVGGYDGGDQYMNVVCEVIQGLVFSREAPQNVGMRVDNKSEKEGEKRVSLVRRVCIL
jgi:hypothetical protein